MKLPRLSKALASKIRGAQDKLQQQISTHIWAERAIPEIQEKLTAFDADPVGWSEQHYRGHGPDSYPVKTHISRSRESLERKTARRGQELQDLKDAQDNLAKVEGEVMAQAARIRPTTPTEPWPKPLESIEIQALKLKLETQREEAKWQMEKKRREAQYALEDAREAERRDREDRDARRRHVAKGAEHVIIHMMTNRYIKSAFEQYKATQQYAQAQDGNWAGGLISFVTSAKGAEAGAEGAVRGKMMIAEAKSAGEDLWSVCRRNGFWTPQDIE